MTEAWLERIGARAVRDDTRLVQKGDVFVWDARIAPGAEKLAADARARGAALVLTNARVEGAEFCPEPGKVLAAWAERTWPGQPEVVLGVTGTSGKTSVAWFGRQMAALAGKKAASVGTLGVMRSDFDMDEDYTGYTTPSALKMHPVLQRLAREGVSHCMMEVSSHALEWQRADGVRFTAGALTNISQDHLDYHKTMEAYAAAKMRFFAEVLPGGAGAVVNVNRRETLPAAAIAKQRGLRVLTVGTANAELVVAVDRADARGVEAQLKFDAVPVPVRLPLVGGFQAENLAVACGLLLAGGMAWSEVAGAAAKVTGVPGRMELIVKKGAPSVVVDYAHKPDALTRALESLRPLVKGKGKLAVVFGCGGNRDAGKRPLMGKIAAELADRVYVTDDNPRKEDAAAIRAQVMAGAGKGAREVADRRAAIIAAVDDAGAEDVILLAGKGHEQGQIVGTEVLPFDDRVVAREILGA